MSYIGSTPTTQSFIAGTDYFNGDGSTTAFTLSRSVVSTNDIEAVINNVEQQPNTAYTVSGTTITFTSAPSAGTSNIYVRYLSTTTQSITPSQNTVSYSTLNSDNQSKLGISFKNRIINGAMVISQRNGTSSVTTGDGTYVLDRWFTNQSQASKLTVQQNAGSVTPPAGFPNYLGITVAATATIGSTDYFNLAQNIEGFNTADLGFGTSSAKTITLSAWVYSSTTGTFGGAVRNSAANRSYPFTYTISAANTWTQISVTIPGDTSGTWVGATNGIGLSVFFSFGVGSTYSATAGAWTSSSYIISATGAQSIMGTVGNTFYLTGVQLEVGTQATTFDYRSIGTELALCQRYYSKSYSLGTVPGTSYDSSYAVPAFFIGTGNFGFVCGRPFAVAMRTAPTITIYAANGTAGSLNPWNGAAVAVSDIRTTENGITGGSYTGNTTVGLNYGFGYAASAEL